MGFCKIILQQPTRDSWISSNSPVVINSSKMRSEGKIQNLRKLAREIYKSFRVYFLKDHEIFWCIKKKRTFPDITPGKFSIKVNYEKTINNRYININ